MGVVMLNVGHDGLNQFRDAVENTPPQAFLGDVPEPAFHQVQPGAARRGEVDVKPRMSLEPTPDPRMLVGGIVVDDQMQIEVGGSLGIDQRQKLDPFLMPMLRQAGANQPPLSQFQGRKQGGGSVSHVIMRQRPTATLLQG